MLMQDIMELCPSLSISSIEGALRKLVDLGKLKREGLCDDILSIFPNSFRRERVI